MRNAKDENPQDLQTSEVVTSKEGSMQLMMVANDVVGLFPAMRDRNTGIAAERQVMKSRMVIKGVKYREVARYVAGNRQYCGDLTEVENILPRLRTRNKRGRKAGMQNKEMKGKVAGLETVWEFPSKEPTSHQKRVLLSKMARIAIHVLWSNFMYEFAGDVYVQTEGGPIGARCTMAASRLVMQEWSEGYLDILTRSGIRVDALQGYVDDGRQWTELIRRGTRFVQRLNRFLWREDWERIDVEENLPEEVRMGKICLEAMNAVNSDLTFTVETVHDFPNKRLATLDLEVDVVDNQIIYSYFQKTMKTPLVIDERSAMSDHQKFSILTNEVIRRMSNISEKISIEEKVQVINTFTQELKNSGYNRKRAREIVVCGLLGLERKRMRRKREGQPFHRPGKMTAGKRNRKKLTGKTDWFKTKSRDIEEEEMKKRELKERIMEPEKKEKAGQSTTKRGKDPQSVMFVPYTPNSELAKELRKVEDMMEALSGMRIKIVEKAGIQMKQILVKSNPWAGSDCGREGCLPCETKLETGQGAGKPCYKRSCIYETWCETCKEGDEEEAREEGKGPWECGTFQIYWRVQ